MSMTIDPTLGASNAQALLDDTRQRMQAVNDAAATYLGLSQKDLQAQLQSGQSLADIAAAQGKDPAGLKATLLKALQGAAGPAATAGSAAQFGAAVDNLIQATGTGVPRVSTIV